MIRFYDCTKSPFTLHGLLGRRGDGDFWRLPDHVIDTVSPAVSALARRPSGARVRFATDAPWFEVVIRLKTLGLDPLMALCATAGADVYVGDRFGGPVYPPDYSTPEARGRVEKSNALETVTINLPRNEQIAGIEVGLPEGYEALPAPEYSYKKPVVFYGSSITEGGAASHPGNAYTSLVCRRLDADYANLGFARSAKGEPALARYIATINMSAFVLDYDHNADTPQDLAETHEPFFHTIRQSQPDLPILLLTRPNTDRNPADAAQRREIVRQTYQNARQKGDNRVWFLDGGTLFDGPWQMSCTVDGIHPNDAGFMRMAEKIYPFLQEALKGSKA